MKRMLLASTFEVFEPKLDGLFGDNLSNKKVVCIPTAAYAEEGHEEWLPLEMQAIQKRVESFVEFDIAGKSYNEVEAVTKDADIIYTTGGNTYHLLEQARACDLKVCIEKCFDRGGMYFGSSAGAIITGPRIDFVEGMDINLNNIDNFEGLNLTNFLFLPHIDHTKFGPMICNIANQLRSEKENVFGLKDDQALYIEGSYIRII